MTQDRIERWTPGRLNRRLIRDDSESPLSNVTVMNYDEFAFANQQLAGMLRAGIPLEGALRQLATSMQAGDLRAELTRVEQKLAQGIPLREAVAGGTLPEFYVRMMQIAAESDDLPGILTLLADYYQRKNALWTRLRGLLIYPAIVLVASLAVTIFISVALGALVRDMAAAVPSGADAVLRVNVLLFAPICALTILGLVFAMALSVRQLRSRLRWRVSAFREANLSNFAASLQMLLQRGASLNDALRLLRQVEGDSPLGVEIERWLQLLASGKVKSGDLAAGSRIIPPLFFWLIAGDEENWSAGLGRAAELYYRRATQKIDALLYAALPVAILLLGSMIMTEIYPVLGMVIRLMDTGFDAS